MKDHQHIYIYNCTTFGKTDLMVWINKRRLKNVEPSEYQPAQKGRENLRKMTVTTGRK